MDTLRLALRLGYKELFVQLPLNELASLLETDSSPIHNIREPVILPSCFLRAYFAQELRYPANSPIQNFQDSFKIWASEVNSQPRVEVFLRSLEPQIPQIRFLVDSFEGLHIPPYALDQIEFVLKDLGDQFARKSGRPLTTEERDRLRHKIEHLESPHTAEFLRRLDREPLATLLDRPDLANNY